MKRHRDTESPQRAKILQAAAEVFAEQGFAGAGVDEIARRAGVNKAMLYYHVGDKARLYAEVVLAFIADVEAEVAANTSRAKTPIDKLAGYQRAFMTTAILRPEYPRIMLRELATGGATLPTEVMQRMIRLLAVTREIVAEGRAAGDFREIDPLLTHILVVGSVVFFANAVRLPDRLVQEGAQLPTFDAVPGAAAGITDILLYGIAARPATGGAR